MFAVRDEVGAAFVDDGDAAQRSRNFGDKLRIWLGEKKEHQLK